MLVAAHMADRNLPTDQSAAASFISPMPFTPSTNTTGTSRRAFCSGATTLLLAHGGLLRLAAQVQPSPPATPTRPDVAAVDRDRILAAAERYLAQQPTPVTSLPGVRSPGAPHDYYSEAQPIADTGAAPPTGAKSNPASPPPFTAHRDALFTLGLAVPALAAAHLLTGDDRYAEHAAVGLRAWFVDPATRMNPSLNFGQVMLTPAPDHVIVRNNSTFGAGPIAPTGGRFEGILETVPLVEIAQAIPFLASSPALGESDRKALHAWFAAYLLWLTAPQDSGQRLAALARDQKNHHATSWLLQTCAYATLTAPEGTAPKSEDSALEILRHRFKSITLRAQISPEGTFPHELSSATPYRDSLFNLDMMAGVCHLLTNRFESVWDYQLEDGPGMRSVIAYHFPFIADRGLWPYRADVAHFDQLPGRRASLLLTARAYQRPEYAALWKTLPPDPAPLDILRTLPIHQPLLWVRQPPRV
jgi:hypothetical protein